jgi:hypothetical protein
MNYISLPRICSVSEFQPFPEQLKGQLFRLGMVPDAASDNDFITALSKLYAAQMERDIVNIWGGIKRILDSTSSPQLDTFFGLLRSIGGEAHLGWAAPEASLEKTALVPIGDRAAFWTQISQQYQVCKAAGSKMPTQIAREIAITPDKIPSIAAQLYRMLAPQGQTNRTLSTVLPLIHGMGGNLQILWVIKMNYSVTPSIASPEEMRQLKSSPNYQEGAIVGRLPLLPENSAFLQSLWLGLES